jgi:hypothetical protein
VTNKPYIERKRGINKMKEFADALLGVCCVLLGLMVIRVIALCFIL